MNRNKFFLQSIFYTIISTIITGPVLQTFMLESDISEELVGVYFSVMSIIQVFIMLFLARITDKIKNIVKASAYVQLLHIPFVVLLILICFLKMDNIFAPVLVFGIITNLVFGIYSVLLYKLPYHIIDDMKNYGSWAGLSSVFSGTTVCLLSMILTFSQKRIEYMSAMMVAFCLCLGMVFLFFWSLISCKPVDMQPKMTNNSEKVSLFKYKPFVILIIPNLLRGFCAGIVSMAVTIGYFADKLDSYSSSILLIITQVSTIVGALVYTCFAKKERRLILFCSIGILVTLPLMVSGETSLFLVFYGVAYLLLHITNLAVPVAVVRIVDYKVAGQYNGARMLLHTLGTFFASLSCGFMLNKFGTFSTLLLAGATQVISGFSYYLYLRKRRL